MTRPRCVRGTPRLVLAFCFRSPSLAAGRDDLADKVPTASVVPCAVPVGDGAARRRRRRAVRQRVHTRGRGEPHLREFGLQIGSSSLSWQAWMGNGALI